LEKSLSQKECGFEQVTVFNNIIFVFTGGHINPAVTFGLFLARKMYLPRAVFYMICQCLGAICGAEVVKGFMESEYEMDGVGANSVAHGYTKGDGLWVFSY